MKTINEAKEQRISAETMGNHFVLYVFFVLHFECRWEGNPSKESVQECLAFVKTLMKTITKCDNDGNEIQNNQDLSGWQRYFHKQLSSIDEKVINNRMKTLEY